MVELPAAPHSRAGIKRGSPDRCHVPGGLPKLSVKGDRGASQSETSSHLSSGTPCQLRWVVIGGFIRISHNAPVPGPASSQAKISPEGDFGGPLHREGRHLHDHFLSTSSLPGGNPSGGEFVVFGVGVTLILFQTPVLELDVSPPSSTLREVPPSRPDSPQVENFGVTCWVNNATLVSDPRRRGGRKPFSEQP